MKSEIRNQKSEIILAFLLLLSTAALAAELSLSSKARVAYWDNKGAVTVDAAPTITAKSLTFTESLTNKCFRLIHDGKRVIMLFESSGYTWTTNNLFSGTTNECVAEITRLKLMPPVEKEEQIEP